MVDTDIEEMNPGIRRTVAFLRSLGFTTTDSGDGKTHEHECDRDEPYVVMSVEEPYELAREADRLCRALENHGIHVTAVGEGAPAIQASYDPANGIGVLDLMGLDDDLLDGTTCKACGRAAGDDPCIVCAGYGRPA
jgi:hypothetical protein